MNAKDNNNKSNQISSFFKVRRGIKLGTLRMRYEQETVLHATAITDRDRVLYYLVIKEHGDIAREYARINSEVRDARVGMNTTLQAGARYGYMEVVKALIANGANVNKAGNHGYIPTYRASRNGRLEVVHALIAAGADVNKANIHGGTPTPRASHKGQLEVVRALIAAGATPPS
jgi:ankyrin repeat protein